MNTKQLWVIRFWLVLVTVLALFPPFEVTVKAGTMQLPLETNTRHGFVLHSEYEIVEIGPRGRLTTTVINVPALLCEFVALSSVCGLLFLSVRSKTQN